MSVETVRAFLAAHAPDLDIVELDASTATVEMAARGHQVAPAQIAKTLSLRIKDRALLIVTSGDARLNNRKIKDVLAKSPAPGSVCVFVGPEGDFSPGELNQFRAFGAHPVSLGPLILRAETAAIAAAAILGDYSRSLDPMAPLASLERTGRRLSLT